MHSNHIAFHFIMCANIGSSMDNGEGGGGKVEAFITNKMKE